MCMVGAAQEPEGVYTVNRKAGGGLSDKSLENPFSIRVNCQFDNTWFISFDMVNHIFHLISKLSRWHWIVSNP